MANGTRNDKLLRNLHSVIKFYEISNLSTQVVSMRNHYVTTSWEDSTKINRLTYLESLFPSINIPARESVKLETTDQVCISNKHQLATY